MKKLSTVSAVMLLLFLASTWVSAQVLLTENFNFSGKLTSNGWTAHSGTGTNSDTTTAGLTYAGYLGSGIGNAVQINGLGGEDDNRPLSDSLYHNGDVAYLSFLVNITDTASNKVGDQFIHLGQRINPTTFTFFAARFFVKIVAGNVNFGLSNTSTATYGTTNFSKNTTYLVIIKYTINTGGNDTTSAWIVPSGIPASEAAAGTPEVTNTSTAGTEVLNAVAVRQGTNGNYPQLVVDGIRVVRSWRSINNRLAVLSKNAINYGQVTVGVGAQDSVIVKDDDATALNVSSVTSGAPVFVVSPTHATIAAGTSQKFAVTYTPTVAAISTSALAFISDAASSPDSVAVTGQGVVPGFTISTKSYSFRNVYVDSTVVDSVTVTNSLASGSLNITSVTSSNPLFTVGPTTGSLGVGASMKFGVSFMPTAAGVASSFIVFANNGGLVSDTLKVTGNGIVKAPGFSSTPALKDFHDVLVGHAWKDSITVKNIGYDSLKITGVTSSDAAFTVTPTAAKLDTQATKKYYVTFTPPAIGPKSAFLVFTSNVPEVTDTVKLVGTGAAFVSIAEARRDTNLDLIPDHSISKDTMYIAGVITSANLQSLGSQTAIFIQDATAGVEIFNYGLPPVTMVIGDSVFAIGTVSQYHGATEFTPLANDTLHFGILKHNAVVPKPLRLTLHQYVTHAEGYEGMLVEIDTLYKTSGTWPGFNLSASIYVTNLGKTDTAQIYISSSTDIGGSVEPAYPINVVAIINQYSSGATIYNNGYEVEPSDSTNILKTKLAQLVKISEARKDLNSDLIPDHSVTGDTLMVAGVITSPNLSATTTSFFIQDSTGGIEVFHTGLPPVTYIIGDSVFAIGKVTQFHGLDELSLLTLDTLHFGIIMHHATVPKAKHVTLHQYVTNPETYEGQLIEIDSLFKASGTWGSAQNVNVTNLHKTDTTAIYINAATPLASSNEPAYPIDVVAIASQFASSGVAGGYEIIPRDSADIMPIVVAKVNEQFSGVPASFVLENNYPNPFNPSTTILYGIASQSHVTVKVYSVLGQEIATLVNDMQSPSYYRVQWNGKDLNGNMVSSGVYFYRIVAEPADGKAGQFTQVKKMLLMK